MNQEITASTPWRLNAISTGVDRRRDLTPYLLVLALSVLLLQRFWLFARVPLILPIAGVVLLAAHRRRAVTIQSDRLLAFLGFGFLALLTTLVHGLLGDVFSAKSIAYLLAIYCLFVVTPTAPRDQLRLLQLWQTVSLLCALLGILQFVVFLVTRQVFDLIELLPPALIGNTGYNIIDFDPTGTFLRANGVVFLEASFFSQFMALALVIEAMFMRNPYRLVCFLIALVCSLSGTGILMVCVALLAGVMVDPASLLQRRAVVPVGGGLLLALLVALFIPPLQQYFADRAADFLIIEPRESSAYIRFIAPWVAVHELLEMGLDQALLGLGPGLFTVARLQLTIDANLNPISQVTVYYGMVTALAYVVFLWTISAQHYTRAQSVVMLTVLFQYLFCSGSLLAPNVSSVLLWFILVFCPSPPRGAGLCGNPS